MAVVVRSREEAVRRVGSQLYAGSFQERGNSQHEHLAGKIIAALEALGVIVFEQVPAQRGYLDVMAETVRGMGRGSAHEMARNFECDLNAAGFKIVATTDTPGLCLCGCGSRTHLGSGEICNAIKDIVRDDRFEADGLAVVLQAGLARRGFKIVRAE